MNDCESTCVRHIRLHEMPDGAVVLVVVWYDPASPRTSIVDRTIVRESGKYRQQSLELGVPNA